MLRSDYVAIQRLMWDADLRRRFIANPHGAEHAELPPAVAARLGPREIAGIEESAYYRIASCARAVATVFHHGSVLLNAFGGLPYLEGLLKGYLAAPTPREATHELFDGYILGPEVIRVARDFAFAGDARWVVNVLEYEWATWHSRRCAMGWAPRVAPPRGFKRPAFVLEIPFEIEALIEDVVRMRAAGVPEAVYRWRCQPSFLRTAHKLIFAAGTDVAEVDLAPATLEHVRRHQRGEEPLAPALEAALAAHGVV